jgi:signal transduction histidine kinase
MQFIPLSRISLLKKFILPQSLDKDQARREFILNILLAGFILLSGIALMINIADPLLYPKTNSTANPDITAIIFVFFCSLLYISRNGKSNISASIFVFLLMTLSIYESYYWGADLAAVLLLFALAIVMAGVLIGTKSSLIVTIISAVAILVLSYLQIVGVTHPNITRKLEMIHMTDSILHVVILGIIALVSWLFNRDIVQALKRARTSEAALKRQRDLLEMTVEERTRELKQVQAEKLMQLYRFAEFGRLASGLFHDLVTPLGLVSLNLGQLNEKSEKMKREEIKALLDRALVGTKRLENFVAAARKQMQNQEVIQNFSLNEEIDQVIQILSYKAKKSHVSISFVPTRNLQTFGNPIKFSQLITNLLLNAIDAYDTQETPNKRVAIYLEQDRNQVRCIVQDWGSGIDAKQLPYIFEPLFTTKSIEKGTGMGLAICRDIVEKDFYGKLAVESKKMNGTRFIITFPIKHNPRGKINRVLRTQPFKSKNTKLNPRS